MFFINSNEKTVDTEIQTGRKHCSAGITPTSLAAPLSDQTEVRQRDKDQCVDKTLKEPFTQNKSDLFLIVTSHIYFSQRGFYHSD